MGHVHVHPEDGQPLNQQLKQPQPHYISINNQLIQLQSQKVQQNLIQSIHLPCFQIKESPFKYYNICLKDNSIDGILIARQLQKNTKEFQNQKQIDIIHPGNSHNISNTIITNALCVFYTPKLLHLILDMLPCEDSQNISLLNHRFSTEVFLYRLFHCPNNWTFTLNQIKQKMQKQNLKKSYIKMLSIGQIEQSQHSLDLERLQSFFVEGEEINQQILRVDKIMKALIASGISYFQGLNSMIIVLLGLFNNDSIYWLIHLLLHRSKNLQNFPSIYTNVVHRIQNKIKNKCNFLVYKLQHYDLDIEYFVMSWIMGLFANELSRNVVLQLWDLIYTFGIQALQWFIVSLFMQIQAEILNKQNGDQINILLKKNIKSLIKGQTARQILKNTRILLAEQIYGEGCADILQPWDFYQQNINITICKLFSYEHFQQHEGRQVIKIQEQGQEQQQSFLNQLQQQGKQNTFIYNCKQNNILSKSIFGKQNNQLQQSQIKVVKQQKYYISSEQKQKISILHFQTPQKPQLSIQPTLLLPILLHQSTPKQISRVPHIQLNLNIQQQTSYQTLNSDRNNNCNQQQQHKLMSYYKQQYNQLELLQQKEERQYLNQNIDKYNGYNNQVVNL